MRLSSVIFLFLGILFFSSTYAWNQVGHKVVMQIAYDNLTPASKQRFNELTQVLLPYYPEEQNAIDSAIWADSIIYEDGVTAFNSWHYVNIPINRDGHKKRYYSHSNIIWAIKQARAVFSSSTSNDFEQSLFLRFLIHFVGDIHQPLHATELYSKQFPKGDEGGNLYLVNYHGKTNLHSVWDECFTLTNQSYPNDRDIVKLAKQLEKQYPTSTFGKALEIDDAKSWAYESYGIAKNFVYRTPYNKPLKPAYQKKGEKICQERLAIAGYRLANMLNQAL